MTQERRPGRLWADLGVDAALKWTHGFHGAFLSMVKAAGQGQPSWPHLVV